MQLTQKKRQRSDLMTAAAVAALLAVMAALLYTGHLTRQVTNMLIPTAVYIVMAVSLNLVVGLLGELSLGHAGFMSVGLFSGCLVALALAETALPLAVRLPVSMLAGGLTAAVFGLLVGLPALRLRGDYLAIVTLACGEIIKNVITNLNFTGGALGLNTTAIYLEMPLSDKASEIETILNTEHDAIMTESETVDEGIANMNEQVQALLG